MSDLSIKAKNIVEALGGKENVTGLDVCITRLRFEIEDMSLVDDVRIKNEGAHWVTKMGGNALQVIWGTHANVLEEELNKLL